MQLFFSSLSVIEQRISRINTSGSRHICPMCNKSDQWISHGFLYKKPGNKSGKRVICSNRYGRSGCGRTQSLYLDNVIPQRRYRLSVLLAFVLALFNGATVEQAYYQSIGHSYSSPRQAWRWLNSLWRNMGEFRLRLTSSASVEALISAGSRRLTLLLNCYFPHFHRTIRPFSAKLTSEHVAEL